MMSHSPIFKLMNGNLSWSWTQISTVLLFKLNPSSIKKARARLRGLKLKLVCSEAWRAQLKKKTVGRKKRGDKKLFSAEKIRDKNKHDEKISKSHDILFFSVTFSFLLFFSLPSSLPLSLYLSLSPSLTLFFSDSFVLSCSLEKQFLSLEWLLVWCSGLSSERHLSY